MPDDFFAGTEKPEGKLFKFAKEQDCIRGNLVGVRENVKGKYGDTTIYEVKATNGWFHEINEDKTLGPKVDLVPGDVYAFFTKPVFEDEMKKAVIGQVVALRFEEKRKSKSGNTYHYIECQLGEAPTEDKADEGEDLPEPVSSDDVPFN